MAVNKKLDNARKRSIICRYHSLQEYIVSSYCCSSPDPRWERRLDHWNTRLTKAGFNL